MSYFPATKSNRTHSIVLVISLLALSLANPTASSSAGSLSLAWDPSPDSSVVGYIVQWGERSGSHTESVDVGDVKSYTIAGLVEGRTYYIIVRSRTAGGVVSAPSNQAVGVADGSSGGGLPPASPSDPDPVTNPTPDRSICSPCRWFPATQVMLAWLMNDEPIPPRHGAPLRVIIPFRYGNRSVKAITEMTFSTPGPRMPPLPA